MIKLGYAALGLAWDWPPARWAGARGRTVLALSIACRHSGIALAIVNVNFPNIRLALAAVLICLIINVVLSLPYKTSRRRHLA